MYIETLKILRLPVCSSDFDKIMLICGLLYIPKFYYHCSVVKSLILGNVYGSLMVETVLINQKDWLSTLLFIIDMSPYLVASSGHIPKPKV